jgi:RNA polymerase sigma-70 factor (ECF subfamily)
MAVSTLSDGSDVAGLPAFEEVYRLHAPRIYRFCLSQLRNPDDAEDVVADVFLSAWSAYQRTPPNPAALPTWLVRIARNAIIDRRRHERRWSALWARLFHGDERAPVEVEQLAMVREETRQVIASMGRLAPRDRLVLGLRLAADLTHAQVGDLLGISEHAATVSYHRAFQRLRRQHEGGR